MVNRPIVPALGTRHTQRMMTTDRMAADGLPPEDEEVFHVVMACEDSASAGSALALCERLASRLAGQLRFVRRCWNLEMGMAGDAERAAPEPAWLDMIILAMHREDRPLPRSFCEYLERCAGRRNQREPAVVA